MDFQEFLRKVKSEIEIIYPENPRLGSVYFVTALLKQVIEKDKTLAERIVKHLEFATPLIKIGSNLSPNKKYALEALGSFRVPDMRGRMKAKLKGLEKISKEYEKIKKKAYPILKKKYRNPNAKLVKLRASFNDIPEERLKEWQNCTPTQFAAKYVDYKYKFKRSPKTFLRLIKNYNKKVERQKVPKMLQKLAENLSSPRNPSQKPSV